MIANGLEPIQYLQKHKTLGSFLDLEAWFLGAINEAQNLIPIWQSTSR